MVFAEFRVIKMRLVTHPRYYCFLSPPPLNPVPHPSPYFRFPSSLTRVQPSSASHLLPSPRPEKTVTGHFDYTKWYRWKIEKLFQCDLTNKGLTIIMSQMVRAPDLWPAHQSLPSPIVTEITLPYAKSRKGGQPLDSFSLHGTLLGPLAGPLLQ